MKALWKLLSEAGPLVLFFTINSLGWSLVIGADSSFLLTADKDVIQTMTASGATVYEPIFVATGLFMVAILIDLFLSRLILKKWPIMPLISSVFVMLFGGLTLYLHDDTFIKIKPTIVNSLFGSILLVGLYFKRLFLKIVLGEGLVLPDPVWVTLTKRWGVFFFILAGLNEFVWRVFGTETWVDYKTWGVMPITILFTLFQTPLLQKGIEAGLKEEKSPKG